MARGKKWISSRTPTEHRLFVLALDEDQRRRSASNKAIVTRKPKQQSRQNAVQHNVKRLYDVERYTQE